MRCTPNGAALRGRIAFPPKSIGTQPEKKREAWNPRPLAAARHRVGLRCGAPRRPATTAIRHAGGRQSAVKFDVREFVLEGCKLPGPASCLKEVWPVKLVRQASSDKKLFAVLRRARHAPSCFALLVMVSPSVSALWRHPQYLPSYIKSCDIPSNSVKLQLQANLESRSR